MSTSSKRTSSSNKSPRKYQGSKTQESSETSLTQKLSMLSRRELRDFLKDLLILEKRTGLDGPRNDDELWLWIKENLHVEVPRTAVCENHEAPFKFIADLYFEREDSAVVVANRSGAKTFNVAILHLVNSMHKPGMESATVGAIEMQAKRAYQHLTSLTDLVEKKGIKYSKITETVWHNKSKVEILPGTTAGVNGPHPVVVHADEVELMDPVVFVESRSMSSSKKTPARTYKAQDIITSTRKRANGPMQKLVDESNEAERNGLKPPYRIYMWCIFETAAKVDNCQVANPDMPDCDKCECDKVVKGVWDDGSPRTLKNVCNGKLAKSNGWIPYSDIVKTFTKTTRDSWEAQQECIRPSTSGLVLRNFGTETNGVRRWEPDPSLGKIYAGIDFGGKNPHAVTWIQVLDNDVDATAARGEKIRLKEGTRVIFDELYIAGVGNARLAEMIAERERSWKKKYPAFRVAGRFADPQGRAARLDLVRAETSIRTQWMTTRDVKEHIKVMVELVDDRMLFVDVERCEMWCEEVDSWHYPNKNASLIDDPEIPVKDFDHAMDASRYCLANLYAMENNVGKNSSSNMPLSAKKVSYSLPKSSRENDGTSWMKQFQIPNR